MIESCIRSLRFLTRLLYILSAATLISTMTMQIRNGVDMSEAAIIGKMQWWGYPVAFKYTAPGVTWAQFNGARFQLNTACWFAAITTLLVLLKRVCRRYVRNRKFRTP